MAVTVAAIISRKRKATVTTRQAPSLEAKSDEAFPNAALLLAERRGAHQGEPREQVDEDAARQRTRADQRRQSEERRGWVQNAERQRQQEGRRAGEIEEEQQRPCQCSSREDAGRAARDEADEVARRRPPSQLGVGGEERQRAGPEEHREREDHGEGGRHPAQGRPADAAQGAQCREHVPALDRAHHQQGRERHGKEREQAPPSSSNALPKESSGLREAARNPSRTA